MLKTCLQRLVLPSVFTLIGIQACASQMRPISVQDCVRTRRVVDQEIQISPDGSQVAYVVKTVDFAADRNHYRLYVRDLRPTRERENGRLLLHSELISGIRWIGAKRIVAKIAGRSETNDDLKNRIIIVETSENLRQLKLPFDFQLYSSSANGRTMAFSVAGRAQDSNKAQQRNRDARGYRVAFGNGTVDSYEHAPEFDVYLGRNMLSAKPEFQKLCFHESGKSSPCSSLRNVMRLNLSPDGKRLLITYSARSTPSNWKEEPIIKEASGLGTLFDTYVLDLYDIEATEMRRAFEYVGTLIHAQWLPDSKHYFVVGASPFGTEEARAEARAAIASGQMLYYLDRFQHVFLVDAVTGSVKNLVHREGDEPGTYKLWGDFPIWTHENEMLVRVGARDVVWLEHRSEEWFQRELVQLPSAIDYVSFLTGDGRDVVGVSQTTMRPPDLFRLDLKTKQAVLLTDLNPEYHDIRLGQVERLEWTNEYGSRSAGLVIKPLDYQPGVRYPMVFLAAYPSDDFISDEQYATTAYAPQPLATAGFVVVVAHYPMDNRVPRGQFPGQMSFAYNWMSMVESVVDLLAAKGMVDSEKVGIGGFSRTSWLTDFTLTHSTHHFVAASSADSGLYTYWSYFRDNSREDMKSDETQLGGSPYGATFADWLKYAVPFNADKVNAAVLMEYVGKAKHGFEFFVALSRLGKAVEFYRYPKGEHPLNTPWERTASLQRNVDWFRFWLQGYERPNAEDPEQYVRWHALRAGREASPDLERAEK